jgi:hypothetical protein
MTTLYSSHKFLGWVAIWEEAKEKFRTIEAAGSGCLC